jgi:hypothetical protein
MFMNFSALSQNMFCNDQSDDRADDDAKYNERSIKYLNRFK